MKAYCLLRNEPWYRREAFCKGLLAAGFEYRVSLGRAFEPGDVLVIWNRYSEMHLVASRAEAQGARVWVAENGYLGAGGTSPKFDVHPAGPKPSHYYALAQGWHNGGGRWPILRDAPERLAALGVELKPWRAMGDYILVCPNRSFGVGERMMHPDWATRAAERLRKQTALPVRIRAHPGNNAPKVPLSDDLAGAAAVVIWSSSAGVHALAEGIPVFCEAPYWILKEAAAAGSVAAPEIANRTHAFERMACAQWTLEEIESGIPFRRLWEMT